MDRRDFLRFTALGAGGLLAAGAVAAPLRAQPPAAPLTLTNRRLQWEVSPQARCLHFTDRATGRDWLAARAGEPLAFVRAGGQLHAAEALEPGPEGWTLRFPGAQAAAVLAPEVHEDWITLRVLHVTGEAVEELQFLHLPLALSGSVEEPFAACALGLNLQTRVPEIPGHGSHLQAFAYPRTGLAGAAVAVVGCPSGELREALQAAVSAVPDLPHSPLGGPWSLDSDRGRASYLFNFGGLSEETVDDWIAHARRVGFNQIQMHGGSSFRFGDCALDPATYPRGIESLRAVIAKLHAAGLYVAMQPYACFISPAARWVTPVPDSGLASLNSYTLAEDLSAEDDLIPVGESTEGVSTITGFFINNSLTLRLEEELVTFEQVAPQGPGWFLRCTRGAHGTRPRPHPAGTPVHHLKAMFGLFVPEPDSPLFGQVAQAHADLFNQAGFDGIYWDALDGGHVLAGAEWAWHEEARYLHEVYRRLERPAAMEMSTFHHHLWYFRTCLGAMDHPTRAHKTFVEAHVRANAAHDRWLLPSNLGWWAFSVWDGAEAAPTFPDDVEYLCARALGTGAGLSMTTLPAGPPAVDKLAEIMRQWETLRRADYFPEPIRARLREPGAEHNLRQAPDGTWRLWPRQYPRRRLELPGGRAEPWTVTNRFAAQPVSLRLEAMVSCEPYDSEQARVLTDFAESGEGGAPSLAVEDSAEGVSLTRERSAWSDEPGTLLGVLSATNRRDAREGAWARAALRFPTPLNLGGHQALGVWVHGEGEGYVLNFQPASPPHLSTAVEEHYVTVDFTGWRYFRLIEPTAEQFDDYRWPYSWPGSYSVFREHVNWGQVERLEVWLNHLPPGRTVTCYLRPVHALPTVDLPLTNPAVTVGGQRLAFPIEIPAGGYLELLPDGSCTQYGPQGETVAQVQPQGERPWLQPGENRVELDCLAPPGPIPPRARLTVITEAAAPLG